MKKILSIAIAGLIMAPALSIHGAHAATTNSSPSIDVSKYQLSQSSLNAYEQKLVNEFAQKLSLRPGQYKVINLTPSSYNGWQSSSQQALKQQPSQSAGTTAQGQSSGSQSTGANQQQSTQTQSQTPSQTQSQQQPTTQPSSSSNSTTQNQSVNSYEQQVVNLTNQERAKQGLPPLKLNIALSKMARDKSTDMRDKGYFSHQSPTYGSPFDMMNSYGIQYSSAGENIAAGQPTPQAVVNAWMNSPGHRANILNKSYTEIGVGYVKGGSYGSYWTQDFIGN